MSHPFNPARWAYAIRHSPALARFEGLWALLRPAYKKMLRSTSGGRGVHARVNGVDDFWFVNRHSYAITWEPEEYAALDRHVKPGMTVFDVGAHDGLYTLALAKRVGAHGRVVSFEPSPDTFEVLRTNVANNGFSDRVRTENCLVGDREAEVDFHWVADESSPLNSAATGVEHLASAEARTIRRPMITLDAFCAREGITPNLIKMDIEGFELNLLRGAQETLRSASPILFMELHPVSLNNLGQSVDELSEFLKGLGYSIGSVTGGPLPTVPDPCDSTFNIAALATR